MNKKELAAKLAAKTEVSKVQADKMLNGVLDALAGALANGEKITFPGFGTFEVRDRAAKQSRNPKTGETIQVPARKAVVFKAGKTLKDNVNQ